MLYSFAFSGSRMKFTSSMVILSESDGSSSRICFVWRQGSHPSVCATNTRRTARSMSRNASRSRSWSLGGIRLTSEIEEIVERRLGAVRRGTLLCGRARLPLDRRARREKRARVLLVFRRDADRERLRALEARARVERHALDAAVKVDAASRAFAV